MSKRYSFSNTVKNPHQGVVIDGYTIIIGNKEFGKAFAVSKPKKPKGENGVPTVVIVSDR